MSSPMVSRVEGQELIMQREFDAPKERVFRAFAEAEHLKNWWGPRGWELTVCNIDFRPGGVWHYCMKCMDESQGDFYGYESWGKGVYGEIEEPERIVYTDYFSDAEGNETEEMPSSRITMRFEEEDGRTRLISHARYDSGEALRTVLDMGMEQGIAETWDRLDEYLQTLR